MNVPLTPAGLGVETGVGVDAGGGVVAFVPPVGFFVGVFVGVFVAFFVGVVVAFFVDAGVGVAAGVTGVVVPPESDVEPPPSAVPVPSANPVVDPNCGGVMERTAPRPPMVPPAIKKKRLLNIDISLIQPSEIQILHYGIDPLEYPHRGRPYVPSLPIRSVRRYTHQSR